MRAPYPITALLLLAGALAACERAPVKLSFAPHSSDLTHHVFPTALYQSDERLEVFSRDQLAALPFLSLLATTDSALYAPATAIRLPFTPAPNDTDRWLDPATLADALRIYRLDTGGPALRVAAGEIDVHTPTNTVTLRPRRPLSPGRYAVVVLAHVITTRAGDPVLPSDDYVELQTRGDVTTHASFAQVVAVDADIVDRRDTLAYLDFTVGDHRSQLTVLADVVAGAAAAVYFDAAGAPGLDVSGVGRVVTGALSTPNFVSDTRYDTLALATNGTTLGRVAAAPFAADNPPSLSASAPFRAIPYLALLPAAPGASPPPAVVAIHDVGRAKEQWLAVAPALCAAGYAVFAIDLYQHGERQADVALPEGDYAHKVDPVLDAAGTRFPDPFINPTFLARTRDKLRQSVVDQLSLVRVLAAADGTRPELDLDGDGAPDAWGRIDLVAHGLGATLATSVLAVSPDIERAVLSAPGGSYAQVLADSPSFGPDIDLLIYATANVDGFGLMAADGAPMLPGHAERDLFDRVAETVLGPVDPLTFAAAVFKGDLGGGRPQVLVQLSHPDLTVPNDANARFVRALAGGAESADAFPVVGPALFATGLPEIDAAAGLPASGVTQREGGHDLLFDFADPAATRAAQAQLVEFLAR